MCSYTASETSDSVAWIKKMYKTNKNKKDLTNILTEITIWFYD